MSHREPGRKEPQHSQAWSRADPGAALGAALLLALETVRTPGGLKLPGREALRPRRDQVGAGKGRDTHPAVTAVIQARCQESRGRGGDGEEQGMVTRLGGGEMEDLACLQGSGLG